MRELGLLLLAELCAFAVASPGFATFLNGAEIARSSVELGCLALGATFVMRTGAIDLSCGAVLALSAIVLGATGSVTLALACGLVCGVVNGLLMTALRVPPLLVTLGTMALYRGLAEGLTGGYRAYTGFDAQLLFLGQGMQLGLPAQLWLLLPVAALAHVVLQYMPFGRQLLAIGLAPGAARHAGIPVARRCVQTFAIAGLLAGLAAVIQCARLGQAKADQGLGSELLAITIAVLGGTRVRGGGGSVAGTLLALLVLAVLVNGLRLAGVATEWAGIASGGLLLLAVGAERLRAVPGPLLDTPATPMTPVAPVAPASPVTSVTSATSAAPADSAGTPALRQRLMSNKQLAILVAAILLAAAALYAGLLRVAEALRTPGSLAAGKTGSEPRLRIALLPKNKSDPYFASCRKGAEEAARELGVDLLWDGPNDTDATKQNEIVESWITSGVDVIAASVENKDAITTVLQKARGRGIKVVTWDADARAEARDFLVNQATAQGIGETLADEAARILRGKGKLAIITASLTAQNQNDWITHIRQRLASTHPGVELVVIRPSEGLRDKAFTEAKNILGAYPDVGVICAIASAAVPGAAEAVKQLGKPVAVIGLSVPSLCRAYVHEGIIESIVLWNTIDLGYLTVQAAHALGRGTLHRGVAELAAGRLGKIAVRGDEVLLGKPFRFTKENIDRFDF